MLVKSEPNVISVPSITPLTQPLTPRPCPLNCSCLPCMHPVCTKVLVKGEPNISYICSRYYRAPELIFGATDYTAAIDVWSVGCVVAELLLGQPLFPGESGVDQLVEIIKVSSPCGGLERTQRGGTGRRSSGWVRPVLAHGPGEPWGACT